MKLEEMLLSKSNRSSRMQSLSLVEKSSKFLERKRCQRGSCWHLEMLAFIFNTFTLESKKNTLDKDKALQPKTLW